MAETLELTFENVVSIAVKIMSIMGFSAAEQMRIMGGPISFSGTIRDIHIDIGLMNQRHVSARCEVLFPIAVVLADLFEGNDFEMRRWLRESHADFGGESMYSLMTSGTLPDMQRALALARAAQV